MSSKTGILFLGATGYLGGTVLTKLLAHSDARTFDITALVRSEDKAKKLEGFGVKTAIGSYKDTALVEKLSEAAHVVFSVANSDDLPSVHAILKGLRQRHERTGDIPVFIHTSGMGVLAHGQQTYGMAPTEMVYDDSDFEQVANIDPAALHRNVDNVIFEADADGYCRTYIVVPGLIYGLAKTPFVDAGIQNPFSFVIELLIKSALDRGQAGMVGKGLSLWANVHVDDQADFFVVLFNAITTNGADNVDHGIRGYYYGESGELSWSEISKEIGRVLVELGLSKSDEPTSFTREELIKYFGSEEFGNFLGTNCRARGVHARSLGWKPKHIPGDLIEGLKETVEVFIEGNTKEQSN